VNRRLPWEEVPFLVDPEVGLAFPVYLVEAFQDLEASLAVPAFQVVDPFLDLVDPEACHKGYASVDFGHAQEVLPCCDHHVDKHQLVAALLAPSNVGSALQ